MVAEEVLAAGADVIRRNRSRTVSRPSPAMLLGRAIVLYLLASCCGNTASSSCRSASAESDREANMTEPECVDRSELRPGPIRHESSPPDLLEHVQAVYDMIGPYLTTILEQFEIGLMRDADPNITTHDAPDRAGRCCGLRVGGGEPATGGLTPGL